MRWNRSCDLCNPFAQGFQSGAAPLIGQRRRELRELAHQSLGGTQVPGLQMHCQCIGLRECLRDVLVGAIALLEPQVLEKFVCLVIVT